MEVRFKIFRKYLQYRHFTADVMTSAIILDRLSPYEAQVKVGNIWKIIPDKNWHKWLMLAQDELLLPN